MGVAALWVVVFLIPPVLSSHADPAEPENQLLSVRVIPEEVDLWGAGAAQRIVVLGQFADGMRRDVSDQAEITVSNPECVRLGESRRIIALTDGEVVLTATVAGRSASAQVRVQGSRQQRPFSFQRDIGSIFTKNGCNTTDCHGGVKGKGGFKLSLNAVLPKDDYHWIIEGGTFQVLTDEVEGERVPRISLEEPEKSLLLQKPTFEVAHGGGERFKVGSDDYRTILDWIRAGAPYGEESGDSVKIEGLELFPREAVLGLDGKYQLLVTAVLSNGRREDATDQALYTSNNKDVAKVSQGGMVEAVKTGETAVMVRAAGHAASATFGVIADPIADYPEIPRHNFIDEHVFAKLEKFNIVPSEPCGDEQFLRRACLDVAGMLPPPERVRQFFADPDPNKRAKLIEVLLGSPEYVEYWTFRFADIYRVAYYSVFSAKGTHAYWQWLRENIQSNKPYDQIAREKLACQGPRGATGHYHIDRPPEDMMSEEVRVLLGRRFDCAQCHNHPYEAWSQNQFWGLTAFFGRLTEIGQYSKGIIVDLPGGHRDRGMGGPILHPRNNQEVQPTFLDGRILPDEKRRDPRMELADWMVSHPYFAEATVNRMWGYFFGRGIVDPVDDFRSTNPPTHPELLAELAADFVEHGYDLKHLIRRIVSSRTYQLSGVPNETNRDDQINYSHALARRLDAEVLLDAISEVTGVPEVFNHESGGGIAPPGTRAVNLIETDTYPSRFLDIHGRPDRLNVPERDGKANILQAMHMLVGSTFHDKLGGEGGRLDRLIKSEAPDAEIIEELCLAALTRQPTADERSALLAMLAAQPDRPQALEDVLWGLISSREFTYNH